MEASKVKQQHMKDFWGKLYLRFDNSDSRNSLLDKALSRNIKEAIIIKIGV